MTRLDAGHGSFTVTGSPAKGEHGALYTGRLIDVEVEPRARAWLDAYEKSPDGHEALESELLESLPLVALDAPIFRGRDFSPDVPPKSCDEFGPPPPQKMSCNRYNAAGHRALYLCSTVDGVRRELDEELRNGRRLWVQRYRLPPDLRLACARNLLRDSFAAAAFFVIESERDAHPKLGHRVGKLIDDRCDGLIVPGVRGDSGHLYWNVVVFRPDDRWERFVDRDAQPELIG